MIYQFSERMKSGKSALGCVLLLALSSINGTVSLKCYTCSHALNLHECISMETCDEGQVCYKRRQVTSQIQFHLGCIDKEECGRDTKHQNASGIAKVNNDQTSLCHECCSKDRCNKNLCEYTQNSFCQDDELIDCAKLNSMFSICEVTSQAKKVCPRYCNLCKTVDENWSAWSSWSTCEVTCGEGSQVRHRSCSNQTPQFSGQICPGKSIESKICELGPCAVHGAWNAWENWGKCSATCGVGMRSRKRSCNNPRLKSLGEYCFGNSIEDALCNKGMCAVSGGWSEWSLWGLCSVTCGFGLQSRTRSCTNPAPINAYKLCSGQSLDVRLCNKKLCPGHWTTWQPWTKCCGQTVQTRKRTCQRNSLLDNCPGNSSEIQSCDETKCSLENVALKKPSAQSSHSEIKWGPEKGNDGNANSNFFQNYCFHTKLSNSPWWEVDLQDLFCIKQVNITNRGDHAFRTQNVEISVAKEHGKWSVVAYKQGQMGAFLSTSFAPVETRYVRVTLRNANTYMHLCEVEVFGCK